MLARAAIETLIVGLYCLHEPQAVAQLQGENVRTLGLLLRYLSDARILPAAVVEECIQRLGQGAPARGRSPEHMARQIDKATGGSDAISLYERFYRPTASLAVHATGLALLRHVRADETLTRRPGRMWARRSPVRIADACVGVLAAVVARETGRPCPNAERYARRHLERALTPVAMFGAPGLRRVTRPGQLRATVAAMRTIGEYVWSGRDANDPQARTAWIRGAMKPLLLSAVDGNRQAEAALDPALDYWAAQLAAFTGQRDDSGGPPAA